MQIIDRTGDSKGKNRENIRRYVARRKDLIHAAVKARVRDGKIEEISKGQELIITVPPTHEPEFHKEFTSGKRHIVLPGNNNLSSFGMAGWVVGDRPTRPEKDQGSGQGNGQDSYAFTLSVEEFLNIFFDDLELPDLMRKQQIEESIPKPKRTGFSNDGSPSQLDLTGSCRNAMARRIALKRPKSQALEQAEADVAGLADDDISEEANDKRALYELLKAKSRAVPWMDPVDFRYKRFDMVASPESRAVMFCLMDVSGSMSEQMKDFAKRFFVLLCMFLQRKYQKVDLVFIRHTQDAEVVDQEAFFNDPKTGGTVVSPALAEMKRIMDTRYSSGGWNIYGAQASDGDNESKDKEKCQTLMSAILPRCQYYAYIEVGAGSAAMAAMYGVQSSSESEVWKTYAELQVQHANLAMKKIKNGGDIAPVFTDLFKRRPVHGYGVSYTWTHAVPSFLL